MIVALLQNDMNFRRCLESFLITLNPNINWNNEFTIWINKNKDDDKVYELIRSNIWIDQDIGIDEHLIDKYILITRSLMNITDDHVYILSYDKTLVSTKIEQEMELYKRIIEEFLTSRLITFEYTDEIIDHCIDFGWLCRDDCDQIWENTSVTHISYYDINKTIPYEYINVIKNIYLQVFHD